MEIVLNLAWAALAISMVGLWFRIGNSNGIDRRRQIVTIAVLIAILFPVISVSDDLLAMQSATEQNGTERRDLLGSPGDHSVLAFAAIVSVFTLDKGRGSVRFDPASSPSLPSIEHPELSCIENRPPPAA